MCQRVSAEAGRAAAAAAKEKALLREKLKSTVQEVHDLRQQLIESETPSYVVSGVCVFVFVCVCVCVCV